MSDITLTEVRSGYNLGKINENFEKIEDKVNNGVLHTSGGKNIMGQNLDMNGNRILNLPAPINDNEPARLIDLNPALNSAIDGLLAVREELVTIESGVTQYTFPAVKPLVGSAFYIRDVDGDLGARLVLGLDYTLTPEVDEYTLTLTRTWGVGSVLQRVYNSFSGTNWETLGLETTTQLIASISTGVVAGTIIETSGYTQAGDGGGGKWKKTNSAGTAGQNPVQRGSASITDASGTVYEYVGTTINLNALGMNTASSCGEHVSLGCSIIRNSITSANSGSGVDPVMPRIITANPGKYFTTTSINATLMNVYQWVLDFEGVSIRGDCTGKTVLDMLGSRFGKVRGLLILGSDTLTPAQGIQYGRITSGVPADNLQFENVKTNGYFSRTALYNRSSETELWEHPEIYNQIDVVEAYCHIFDGNNTWGIISDYVTEQITQYTNMSCIQHTFINPDWRHGGGRVMWMSYTHQFKVFNGYQVCTTDNAITMSAVDAGFDDIDFDIHSETSGMASVVSFELNPAATGTIVNVRGFKLTEEAGQPSDQYFRAAASVTKVNLTGAEIRISRNQQTPTNGLVAPSGKFVIHGSIYSGSAFILKGLHEHYGILTTPTLANTVMGVGSYTIYETNTGRTYHKGDFNPISSRASIIDGDDVGLSISGVNFTNGVMELTGRSTLPTAPASGSYITVDNGTNWSGVNPTGLHRPVFWDGSSFIAMF